MMIGSQNALWWSVCTLFFSAPPQLTLFALVPKCRWFDFFFFHWFDATNRPGLLQRHVWVSGL